MFKTLTGAHALELHKQEILLRCAQDRIRISGALEDLDSRTRWYQLAGQAVLALAPRLRLLLPLAGFLVSRKLAGGRAASWVESLSSGLSFLKTVQEGLRHFRTHAPRS